MLAIGKMNSNMEKALKLGLMGVSTLEILRREKCTDLEGTPGLMDSIMKAKWSEEIFMAKVKDYLLMEGYTRATGRMM
jgi:hypothetical protein